MLTEAEHQALARMACRSLSLPPAAHTLPAAVLAAAERVPAAVAVADADGTLTYRELVTRASALASELRARGAGADEPVAVLLPRGRDLVIAMLAAQLAGSPYLPLEVSHPRARRAAILADARPVVTVTDAAHATADTVLVDAPRPGASAPTPPAHPDTLAHLIYTSGSTGTPKGVACTHRAVLNLLANHASFAPVAAGDVVGWWTSPGFDVSVLEVFSALVAGATVAVCPDPARLDAAGVLDWLARAGVTHAYLPPHLLHPVAELLTAGRPGLRLRHLLVGVEPIPAALLRRLMRLVPGLRVVNGYGPTEATVCATFHAVDPADVAEGPVPLGIGLANCPAHVFDRHGRPAPIGSVGELYLGGVGLARGYHRGPGRTAERFVPDPFRPGGRLYRTGDLARREPDGTLVFVGRVDDQVKVRGMRVEPAEVAAAMTAHPGVASSVVVADGVPPDVRLVGYVVAEPTSGPDLAGEVLRDLRGRLPGPMVPSAVVLVDEWPTTVNGKVDRAALPAPRRARATGAPPVGPVEIVIAEVWAELLEIPDVSRTDDFFELGGHSLLATRACAGIAARLGVSVEPAHLVNHPTVAGLGAALAAPPAERDEPNLALVLAEHVADLPEELLRELDEEGLS
jgi:amino acid adenylation domain-containing protein